MVQAANIRNEIEDRLDAQARACMVVTAIDIYIHTLPPPARKPALIALLKTWIEHGRKWVCQMDAGTAGSSERRLTPYDWTETEAALRMLLRDIEQADA